MRADALGHDGGTSTEIPRATRVSPTVIEMRFEHLVSELKAAIADPVVAQRLAMFDFNATIRVKEADHLEAWLLFHGVSEIGDTGGGAVADVEVTIPAAMLETFWSEHLALEILEGRATYTGCVRRLLTLMPVMRAGVLRRRRQEAAS